MKPRLIIVDKYPTQFDAPLYAFLSQKASFDLTVFYAQVRHGVDNPVDPEIERAPEWDHLRTCDYARHNLTHSETANAKRAAEKIIALRPDLVVFVGYYPMLLAKMAWILKRNGIRIGLRSDNIIRHSDFRGAKGVFKNLVLPSWLSLYDTWHPVGTLAQQYLETVSRTKKPTYLFPYNVDNNWFSIESARYRKDRDELRQIMGFSPGNKVILGVMKWHEREDPLTLVDSFVKMQQQCRDVRLILLGNGPLRDIVRAKAIPLGESIFMPGYVPYSELPKYYAVSDLFVHPATRESWGVSVNEAMACGLPVIAAASVGSGADLIVEGATGAVYPDRDSDALCQKLAWILNDRELLKAMGSAAREKVSGWSYAQTFHEFAMALDSGS